MPIDESRVDRALTTLRRAGVALVTYNKKPGSAKNFKLNREGTRARDGFWKTAPSSVDLVKMGVHFELGHGPEPSKFWIGNLVDKKPDGERWIFLLEEVQGPFTTRRKFKELFGTGPQASFIYFPARPNAKKSPAFESSDPPADDVRRQFRKAASEFDGLERLAGLKGEDVSVLAKRRLGHGALKKAVHALFDYRCCMSSLGNEKLLVCSHIRPWAKCANGADRVNPANTLLLAANWDAAFDRGLIAFDERGGVIPLGLSRDDANHLGINLLSKLPKELLTPDRIRFLKWHRQSAETAMRRL